LGMNPYVFKNSLMPQLKKFKLRELLDMYQAMCDVDIHIKGSSLDKRALLENFLIQHLK